MSLALFFGVLVLLLVLTVPICVSFAFVTLLPSIVDASFPYTADAAVRSMVSGLNNFPLLAIPLFIIAGVIMAKGQISERLFNVFSYFVGNRTAGLPCAVTITCLLLLCKQAAKIFQTICKKETALKRVLRNLLSAISFAQI